MGDVPVASYYNGRYQPLRSEHNDFSQFQVQVTAADIQNELNAGRAGQFYLTRLGNNGIILFQLVSYDGTTGNVSLNQFVPQTGQWVFVQEALTNMFGLVYLGNIFPQSAAAPSGTTSGSSTSPGTTSSPAPSSTSTAASGISQILGQAESILGLPSGGSSSGGSAPSAPSTPSSGTISIPGIPGTFQMPTQSRDTAGWTQSFKDGPYQY